MLRKPLIVASQALTGTTTTNYVTFPQDVDSIFAVAAGTLSGTSSTYDVYLQTTPDGGTTWYDVGHFGQIVGTTGTITTIGNYNGTSALTLSLQVGSSVSSYTGTPSTATLAAGSVSKIPVLDPLLKIYTVAGGTIGTSTITVSFYATQSAQY